MGTETQSGRSGYLKPDLTLNGNGSVIRLVAAYIDTCTSCNSIGQLSADC